jgi:hypothetical protein
MPLLTSVKSSWKYHTLNLTVHSAHTSVLLTAQHMTHRGSTLVSAFELEHKHQTDLCATSIVNNETKTMHATQQYKVHNNIMRTI